MHWSRFWYDTYERLDLPSFVSVRSWKKRMLILNVLKLILMWHVRMCRFTHLCFRSKLKMNAYPECIEADFDFALSWTAIDSFHGVVKDFFFRGGGGGGGEGGGLLFSENCYFAEVVYLYVHNCECHLVHVVQVTLFVCIFFISPVLLRLVWINYIMAKYSIGRITMLANEKRDSLFSCKQYMQQLSFSCTFKHNCCPGFSSRCYCFITYLYNLAQTEMWWTTLTDSSFVRIAANTPLGFRTVHLWNAVIVKSCLHWG